MTSTTSSSDAPGRSYDPKITSTSAVPPSDIRSSATVRAQAASPVGAIQTASGSYDGGADDTVTGTPEDLIARTCGSSCAACTEPAPRNASHAVRVRMPGATRGLRT